MKQVALLALFLWILFPRHLEALPEAEALTLEIRGQRSPAEIQVEVSLGAPSRVQLRITRLGGSSPLERVHFFPPGRRRIRLRPPGPGDFRVEVHAKTLALLPAEPLASFGRGALGFHRPVDLALTPEGDLAVLDRDLSRVQVLTPRGRFRFSFGETSLLGKDPTALAISPSGYFHVLSPTKREIQRFSRTGRVRGEPQTYAFPRNFQDLEAPRQDEWILLDPRRHQLEILRGTTFRHRIGSFGEGPGRLHRPNHFLVQGEDLWVADWTGPTLKIFSSGGQEVARAALEGSQPFLLPGPDHSVASFDPTSRRLQLHPAEDPTHPIPLDLSGVLPEGTWLRGAFHPNGDLFLIRLEPPFLYRVPSGSQILNKTGQLSFQSVR